MVRPIALFALLAMASLAGCRLDAECFGSNECQGGLVCYRGNCVTPFDIGDAGPDGGLPRYTWIEHVEPIVRAHCQTCHASTPVNNAPFSLVSYADTQANAPAGGLVHQRMAARTSNMSMPPSGSGGLSAVEINVIRVWSEIGAPEGEAPDAGVDGGVPDVGDVDGGPRNPIMGVATPTRLMGGFLQLEAPTWRPVDRDLLFIDLPGHAIRRLVPPSALSVFMMGSNDAAAMRIHPNGDIVVTQFITRRIARLVLGSPVTDVSIVDNWIGRRFNSPNDLDIRADGTIYFSDSAYGLNGRPREIAFNGLFRVTASSSVTPEWRGPIGSGPNGVELSEDEQRLYLSDTEDNLVRVFDVNTNGSLSNERIFASNIARADGMSHDEDGNLYVAGRDGITVLSPDGVVWGTISIGESAANSGFGGNDRHTLYIAGETTLFAVLVPVPGTY